MVIFMIGAFGIISAMIVSTQDNKQNNNLYHQTPTIHQRHYYETHPKKNTQAIRCNFPNKASRSYQAQSRLIRRECNSEILVKVREAFE